MTIHITQPEVQSMINQRLADGPFRDAEDVILEALKSSQPKLHVADDQRSEAISRLMAFAKTHGLTLGAMTIHELRQEARP